MFEVKKHLIKVQGNRLYLPVAARLVWFRQEHPDWGIETRPIVIDMEKQYAIFEAKVYNSDGKLMAQGTKMENVRGFPDFIEKAETGSIGRALAVCGFGTQFAPDLDEVPSGRVVDAPQPDRSSATQNGIERAHGNNHRNGFGHSATNGANAISRADSADGHSAARPSSNGSSEHHDGHDADARRENRQTETNGHREAATAHDAQPATSLECSLCRRSLTKGQELLSIRKFGVALCPECQKERRSVEAAA